MSLTTTLEIHRSALAHVDDDAITIEVPRPALPARLAQIAERQRAARERDQVFALAMLCLAIVIVLGLLGA